MALSKLTTNNQRPGESQKSTTNGIRSHGSSSTAALVVGTFRPPALYTLTFESAAASRGTDATTKPASCQSPSLTVSHKAAAVAGHSWLALSPSKTNLYTTCWTSPPTVAAYSIHPDDQSVTLLNTAPVASRSAYVAVTPSGRHLISVGGPTGEVFRLSTSSQGELGPLVQTLNFRQGGSADDGKRDGVAHGGFGGLRWGSHSVDVSPDGASVYVADIGHNCIWTYHLNDEQQEEDDDFGNESSTTTTTKKGEEPLLTLGTKHISPRSHDGPRHAWPHPSGRVLYVVQEHSSMVDAFSVAEDGITLAHLQGYTILPEDKKCDDFWADEVRTSHLFTHQHDSSSTRTTKKPRYLYASTRGLQSETKGYVAAYELDPEGRIQGPAVEIYETRTSGGLANAVEPAPAEVSRRLGGTGGTEDDDEEELIALTDSEEGWVMILGWNGRRFREVAATKLGSEEGDGEKGQEVVQAATAVWL